METTKSQFYLHITEVTTRKIAQRLGHYDTVTDTMIWRALKDIADAEAKVISNGTT